MKKSTIYKTAQVALMAVFIAVCAWITIPSPVPFTMQTFGVYLTLLLLGGKRGTASILLYILLGAVGLPVFSSFGSGAGYLLGPTGGYIFGFILLGLFYTLTEKSLRKASYSLITLGIGTVLCYTTGTVWFVLSTGTSLTQSLLLCTLPYVIPDALKLFTAYYVSKRLRKIRVLNIE